MSVPGAWTSTEDALAANPVFRGLEPAVRDELIRGSQRRSFAARERVLTEGAPSLEVFVLLTGSVRVFHVSPQGVELLVKLFKPPAVFGEMEAMVGLPLLENVEALEPSDLLVVPRDVFVELVERHPAVAVALVTDLSARLCIATHNERALAFHDVRTRLARFLVSYAEFDGEEAPGGGVRIRLKITQDDMAQALGVTRRAVASEIARWREQGVLDLDRGHYRLRDLEVLRREAGPANLSLVYSIGQDLGQALGDGASPAAEGAVARGARRAT